MELEKLKEYILGWASDEGRDSGGTNISCAKLLSNKERIKATKTREELINVLKEIDELDTLKWIEESENE